MLLTLHEYSKTENIISCLIGKDYLSLKCLALKSFFSVIGPQDPVLGPLSVVPSRQSIVPTGRLKHAAQFSLYFSGYMKCKKLQKLQIKGDIYRSVLNTSNFLCNIRKPRYRENNTGYQIIKGIKYMQISTLFLKSRIVLSISRLPGMTPRTACTQNIPMDVTFYLSTRHLLCNIEELRYRQNNRGYQLLRIGY